ncbi:MAG: (5-formylfuran-3-yl)methyl phosphate synthase, partial [Planctomycetaceae bacterium]
EAVVEAAVATRCAGMLIDTWNKSRGDLLEQMDVTRLQWVRRRTREAGLLLGLAGRVTVDGLPRVVALKPDVVAIRSAACLEGQREQAVDSGRVALFAERLRKARESVAAMSNEG